ncbi:MAG: TRAP transporter small permease [Lachnospiraceae bacterium]|nr:TRAP transporter small permease [Lachnospiraceae bacterium]
MSKIEKWADRVLYLMALFSGWVFVAICVLTAIHTVGRYLFSSPIMGNTELVSLGQIIAVSFAAAYVQYHKGHIAVGLLVDNCPPKVQAMVDFITYFISLVFCGIAAWETAQYAIQLLDSGKVTLTLRIAYYPFYFILAFGWLLIALVTIIKLIQFVQILTGRREEGSDR